MSARLRDVLAAGLMSGASIGTTRRQTQGIGSAGQYAAERQIKAELLYQYSATLDTRASPICQELDGQVFDADSATAGVDFPPTRPFRRSATIARFGVLALKRYISSRAYTLNQDLRNGAALTADDKKLVKDLDSALDKLPPYKGDVQRAVLLEGEELDKFLKKHKPGNTVKYEAYTSFSTLTDYNAANVQVHATSSKAKDMRGYNQLEKEVLYKRNAEFEVDNVFERNGVYNILLKEL